MLEGELKSGSRLLWGVWGFVSVVWKGYKSWKGGGGLGSDGADGIWFWVEYSFYAHNKPQTNPTNQPPKTSHIPVHFSAIRANDFECRMERISWHVDIIEGWYF